MTHQPDFHIPVLRSDFFEDNTHEAISRFLDANITLQDGAIITAVRTDYLVHSQDAENVTAAARVSLYASLPDGDLLRVDPKDLTESALALYAPVAIALSVDDLGVQSVAYGILPWADQGYSKNFLGRLFTHIQTRHFALFGDEYPATQVANPDRPIAGPDADETARRFFMNLILPPVASSHGEMAQYAHFDTIRRLAPKLYDVLLDGQCQDLPLAEIDFSTITTVA